MNTTTMMAFTLCKTPLRTTFIPATVTPWIGNSIKDAIGVTLEIVSGPHEGEVINLIEGQRETVCSLDFVRCG
jgi:hypothetical protein